VVKGAVKSFCALIIIVTFFVVVPLVTMPEEAAEISLTTNQLELAKNEFGQKLAIVPTNKVRVWFELHKNCKIINVSFRNQSQHDSELTVAVIVYKECALFGEK